MDKESFEIGFITALIEGEGEVNISYTPMKDKKGQVRYGLTPRISISNASLPLIEKARAILGDIGGIRGFTQNKRKKVYQLEIMKREDAYHVCLIVEPHAIGKKVQFQILKRFIESRANRSKDYKGKFPFLTKPPYNYDELEMFKAIKEENAYTGKGYGKWKRIYASKLAQIKKREVQQ